jgi:hypothetical protein
MIGMAGLLADFAKIGGQVRKVPINQKVDDRAIAFTNLLRERPLDTARKVDGRYVARR